MKIQAGAILVISIMLISTAFVGTIAPEEKVPVIIGFKGKSDAALVKAHGGEIKHQYTIINAIAAKLPPKAIEALKKNKNIDYIEEDAEVHTADVTPWGVDRIDAEKVWVPDAAGYPADPSTGNGVKVAIIDTGVDYSHPDLSANFDSLNKGYDFVNGDSDPMDDNGHGTHVAGTIGAKNNGIGVVGVAPDARLYAVKVLDSSGSGSYSNVIAGINWAVNSGMKVVSMSLGGTAPSTALQQACDNAYSKGVVVVAAAGNSGSSKILYPARYNSVIAVGATDQSNRRAYFSNYGRELDLVAPGVNIYSTLRNNGYGTMSGTSMATPHVSGTVALILENNPGFTVSQVRNTLYTTADDLGTKGWDKYYGNGLVDAEQSVTGTQTP